MVTVRGLLRQNASSPSPTGSFEINMPDGWPTNRYNHRVLRLLGDAPEPHLTVGVNLVPLAALANVTERALPRLVDRMAADQRWAEPPIHDWDGLMRAQ